MRPAPAPSNVIAFPLRQDDRLRIAIRRLANALHAQSAALAGLRACLATLAATRHHAPLNKG